MKIKILILTIYFLSLLTAQNTTGQTKTALTRNDLCLKGNIKSMKYSVYNGRFENDTFIKGKKHSNNYEARPTIHTYFDESGRIIEEINFNAEDVIMERTKFRYNKKGLLLYKQDLIRNRDIMETWRFMYDKEDRLVEYRMYQKYLHARNGKNPEEIFFEPGEFVSGSTLSYNQKGLITEMNHINDRYGKVVFYYDTEGNLIERKNQRFEWLKVENIYDNENRLIETNYINYWPVYRVKYWYAVEGYLLKEEVSTNYNRRDSVTFSEATIYDADGQIIRSIDSKKKIYTFQQEKNEYGDPLIKSIFHDETLTNRTFYEYEYDIHGNWITRYVFYSKDGEKSVLQMMEERIFEYY